MCRERKREWCAVVFFQLQVCLHLRWRQILSTGNQLIQPFIHLRPTQTHFPIMAIASKHHSLRTEINEAMGAVVESKAVTADSVLCFQEIHSCLSIPLLLVERINTCLAVFKAGTSVQHLRNILFRDDKSGGLFALRFFPRHFCRLVNFPDLFLFRLKKILKT